MPLHQKNFTILCLIITFSYSQAQSEPVVPTRAGKVRGLIQKNLAGNDYLSFRGIPYAKPPVGPLRFEDPVPPDPWIGVRDAKDYGRICPQGFVNNETRGSGEDCLFVNIFTKGSSIPKQKRPVMVWMYGGSYLFGDGDNTMYGPDYFMRKDVVLVTFNYRLGVLGFLDLQDDIAPGNQGLKDHVMVLKWVRDNIANFGGDPNKVTIFGQSSGGMSVHWVALSPLAKGLFHRAIIQSGNIFDKAIKVENPPQMAYKLVELLGKKTQNHKEIKEFLKTVGPSKLVEAQDNLTKSKGDVTIMFPFNIAIDSKSKTPFMPEDYEKLALQGIQVPLLIGYNNHEIMGLANSVKSNLAEWNNQFETFFSRAFEEYFKRYYGATLNDLKRFYFKDGKITEENYKNIETLYSDTFFAEGNHRTMKIQLEKSTLPTYFYIFTYDKRLSANKKLILKTNEKGAAHTDELEYIFRQNLYEVLKEPPLQPETGAYKLMEQMTEMWVNFATTGNPTPSTTKLVSNSWQPIRDKSNLNYLNLGENLRMENVTSFLVRYSKLNKS